MVPALTFSLLGCGGDDGGIRNGTVVGQVFSSLQGTSAVRSPLAGVTVVLQREAEPALIRTTLSDGNGQYVFSEIPLGTYVVGMAKEGFEPIDTQAGATANRTAVGDQIRVFVESKKTSLAPEATLRALQQQGDASVIFTLIDGVSGARVTHAAVTVGIITQTENQNGVYDVTVPIVRPTNSTPFTQIPSLDFNVQADGFTSISQFAGVDVAAGQTVRRTLVLTPLTNISVTGRIEYSRFQLVAPAKDAVRIQVLNLASATGTVAEDGTFTIINLPSSNSAVTRTIDVEFSHPDLISKIVRAISLPQAGSLTLPNMIILEPRTVDLMGRVKVVDAVTTNAQQVPNGPDDKVIIAETGQVASIINGNYFIPDVPTQQGAAAVGTGGLTLQFEARRPSDNVDFCENVPGIRPVSDGTSNAVFTVREIVLETACDAGASGAP